MGCSGGLTGTGVSRYEVEGDREIEEGSRGEWRHEDLSNSEVVNRRHQCVLVHLQ